MILFLDFDGVLHPIPGKRDLCHRERLEGVIRDFPHLRIVVSSMWRAELDLEGLRRLFSVDVQYRIIDVTPWTETPAWAKDSEFFFAQTRYNEILLWIEQNKYRGQWLALDDSWREFPDPCSELIRCEIEIGFDEKVEQKLRTALSNTCMISIEI